MTAGTESGNEVMISVIIPVYNVAPYVQECLESIHNQTFEHAYEVILVDDCSSDASIEICRNFIRKNNAPKFRIIEHDSNQGVSVVRNMGLEAATGKYLMFVDPDDVLPAGAFDRLVSAAEKYESDIVKGNLVLFSETSDRPAPDRVRAERVLRGEDVLITLYEHNEVRGHIGGKLFRRETLGDLRFTAGVRMAQDLLYFSELFSHARTLVLITDEVYRYRKHQTGSTGRKYEKGSYVDWLSAVERSAEFAETPGQRRAHKRLLVRTMAQIAREARKISAEYAAPVLEAIEQRLERWNLQLLPLLTRDKIGFRSFTRYLKLQIALVKIRRNLARS